MNESSNPPLPLLKYSLAAGSTSGSNVPQLIQLLADHHCNVHGPLDEISTRSNYSERRERSKRLFSRLYSILLDVDSHEGEEGQQVDGDLQSEIDVRLGHILMKMGGRQSGGTSLDSDALEALVDRVLMLQRRLQSQQGEDEDPQVRTVADNALKIVSLLMRLEKVDAIPVESVESKELPEYAAQLLFRSTTWDIDPRLETVAASQRARSFFSHEESEVVSRGISFNCGDLVVQSSTESGSLVERSPWIEAIDALERNGPAKPIYDRNVHIYMTEGGDEEFDQLYRRYAAHEVWESNPGANVDVVPSESQLVEHCIMVLMGIKSATFSFDQTQMKFQVHNVRLPSTGTRSIQTLLSYFARIGTLYVRLYRLANVVLMPSEFSIHQSFGSGINAFLQYFHDFVIHLRSIITESMQAGRAEGQITLLNLRHHTQLLASKLEYLASLCRCATTESDAHYGEGLSVAENECNVLVSTYRDLAPPLDNPATILSILHDQLEMTEYSNERDTIMQPIIFLLFKRSCEPFLQWVQDWIYAGELQQLEHFSVEQYPVCIRSDRAHALSEIEQNLELLNDPEEAERIWSETYLVKEHLLPSFLAPFQRQLLFAGFQLNIIRLFRPTHYLLEDTGSNRLSTSLMSLYDAKSFAKASADILRRVMDHTARHEAYITNLAEKEHEEYMALLREHTIHVEAAAEHIKRYEEYLSELALLKRNQKMLFLQERLRDMERTKWWRDQEVTFQKIEEEQRKKYESREIHALEEIARQQIIEEYEERLKAIARDQRYVRWKMQRFALNEKRNRKLEMLQRDPLYFERLKENQGKDANEGNNEGDEVGTATGGEEKKAIEMDLGYTEKDTNGDEFPEKEFGMLDEKEHSPEDEEGSGVVENDVDELDDKRQSDNTASDDDDISIDDIALKVDGDGISPIAVIGETEQVPVVSAPGQQQQQHEQSKQQDVEPFSDDILDIDGIPIGPIPKTEQHPHMDNIIVGEDEVISKDVTNTLPRRMFDDFQGDTAGSEQDNLALSNDETLLYDSELVPQVAFHELVDQCIVQPILIQFDTITAITKSIFFNELKLEQHFAALQRYFLLQAGDFADEFARILFEGLRHGRFMHNTNSDTFHLNTALQTALKLSEYGETDSAYSERLSFTLRDIPLDKYPGGFLHSLDTLEHIELNYRVEWPLNLIIHSGSLAKYRKLYHFLMKLKRISHIQQDMWVHFRHPAVKRVTLRDPRYRSLQQFRQEIQHFMTIMEQYIMTHVLHVCISQFMQDIRQCERNRDKSIEHIRELHDQFLQRCLARCLQTSAGRPLMGIIDKVFSEILRFNVQVLNNPLSQPLSDVAFRTMMETRDSFHQCIAFLYSTLQRLESRGFGRGDTSFQHLFLQLDYNGFYGRQAERLYYQPSTQHRPSSSSAPSVIQ